MDWINWRALLQNQWFQLCLLVAALSAGTTLYNLSRSKPGPNDSAATPTSGATPMAAPAPRRIVQKIKPKRRGQWILDASGERDADGSDIEAVAASLSDGDVVTLRPGTYAGCCEINVSARFVGPAPNKGVASIRCLDGKRIGVSISGKKVSFENVSINYDATGEWPAMRIWRDAAVEMTGCSVVTQGKFGVMVVENASFSAEGSHFSAPRAGCCLKYEGYGHGTLQRCNFSEGRWGLEAVNAAQVEGTNCVFQRVGLPNGAGLTIGVVGGRTSVTLTGCQFNDNTATILADESATFRVSGTAFRNNGVTGETGNSSLGVICAQNGAKTYLKSDTFDDNKQGLVAIKSGNLILEDVQMHRTGLATDNENLKGYGNAIGATGQDSTVSMTNCVIADSILDALNISGGASLRATRTTISNSSKSALVLGFPKVGASQAELDNVRFLASHGDAIFVNTGSRLGMQDCQVNQAGAIGIEVQDQGTAANIKNTTINACQDTGIIAHTGGEITATNCTLQNNSRGAQAGLTNDSNKRGAINLVNCDVQRNTVFGVGACRSSILIMKGGFLGNNRQNTWHEAGGNVRLQR